MWSMIFTPKHSLVFCSSLFLILLTVTLTCRQKQIYTLKTNQVTSELSIVLDLRLLGKMWHGTRDEQTPQPVRMTLGNKGAIHPPSPCFQWSFLFGFHSCALVYPLGCHWKSNQHGINAVFIRDFVLIGHYPSHS